MFATNDKAEEEKEIIPLEKKKNIIVLLDGTANGYLTRTNILRLAAKLSFELPDKCLSTVETKIAYFEGVGTRWGLGSLVYFVSVCFAFDLNIKVEEAYKFICHEYDPEKENKVWIFGFSRGAYSARILSQMIDKVGVLDRSKYCTDEDTRQQGFSLWSVFMQMLNILVKILSYLYIIVSSMLTKLMNTLPYMNSIMLNYLRPEIFGESLVIHLYMFQSWMEKRVHSSTHPHSKDFENDIITASFIRRAVFQSDSFSPTDFMDQIVSYAKPLKVYMDANNYHGLTDDNIKNAALAYLPTFCKKSHRNSQGCVFFLGLFDTVGSIGVPSIDVDSNGEVIVQFHYSDEEKTLRDGIPHVYHAMAAYEAWLLFKPLEIPYGTQMWFPGVHIDIGGFLGVNPISDATLNWMICHINTALRTDNQLKDANNDINKIVRRVSYLFNPFNYTPSILHFTTKHIFAFLDFISPIIGVDITRLNVRNITICTDSIALLKTFIYKDINAIANTNSCCRIS